jgi:hypothetical protein
VFSIECAEIFLEEKVCTYVSIDRQGGHRVFITNVKGTHSLECP